MCADVSSAAMQDRLQNVQELCEFSEKCRKQLNEVLEELGWSPDRNLQPSQEKMEVCPYDRNHTVPSKSMESHKAACLLSQLKYSKEEQAELCDPSFYYERSNVPTIKLDKQTQHQVILQAQASAPSLQSPGNYCQRDYSTEPADVPQNHKRAICDLTPADRLALYDYVIQKATQQSAKAQASSNEDLYVDLVSKLKKGDKNSGPKSHLEVLAEMRDYRRRRQSYRAKNVHITKKSYTEIIREVIDVHAEELSRVWQEERKDESKPSYSHSSRRASNEVRSASVESRGPRTDSREGHSSRRKHRKSSREHRKESKSRRRDSKSPEERHRKKKKKRSRS